jgi:hypothetical protein
MSAISCEQCREIAPELALGITSGDERALALRHLARCADCREDLRSLSDTADQLLLAAPEVEPSAGFDERVIAELDGESSSPSRSRHTLLLASAAAVVVIALACAALGGWLVGRPGSEETAIREASFGVDDPGTQVVAYDGDPSWLLVMVDGGLPDGRYSVVCDYRGGWSLTPGQVDVRDGRGTWSATVNRTLADLTDVRLQNAAGEQVAHAAFD